MNEIRDYIHSLLKDCHNVTQARSLAEKYFTGLDREVDLLKASTYLLRKRATSMVERVNKASRRRRIKEHLGNYIEALIHKRARLEVGAQKIYKKNEALLEERNRLRAEQLDLQNTIMALRETEELDPFCSTTNDEVTGYVTIDNEEQTHS
jgi:putative cell wall-binding protein